MKGRMNDFKIVKKNQHFHKTKVKISTQISAVSSVSRIRIKKLLGEFVN